MSYRDDKLALEARRDELKHELADAMKRAEALDGAALEMKRLEGELAEVVAKLRLEAPRAPSLLDSVAIASPCTADWDAMKGDDRVRFCGSCAKNVYNLSAMPRAEAEALVAEREASICVRLYQRADGTVISGDCAVGVRKKRRRRLVLAVAGAGAFAAGSIAAVSSLVRPTVVMGGMMPMPPKDPHAVQPLDSAPPHAMPPPPKKPYERTGS